MHNILKKVSGAQLMILMIFVLCFFFTHQSNASEEELHIDIIPSKSTYRTGDSVFLALKIKIPEKYHLYGNPLGPGIGKPFQISVDGVQNIIWNGVEKLKARQFKPPVGEWVWAYENQTVFFIKGLIPAGINGNMQGSVNFNGLICNKSCIPVEKSIPFTVLVNDNVEPQPHFQKNPELLKVLSSTVDTIPLSISNRPSVTSSIKGIDLSGFSITPPVQNKLMQWNYTPLEKKVEFNLLLAMLFGFLAGIVMNVMPCVLPVLGIKIISFTEARENSRKKALLKSLVFSAGMLSVFMILASLASFANFSWGQQFQNPKVLVGIITVIVIFSLGMFDFFMILVPNSISSMGNVKRNGLAGDFLNGMFATILATPCSGPLLGATLAWTLTQQPLVIFTIFTSIGLGMAFPYVLFSTSRTLSGIVPRPGKWMNDFKHLMGFILLGFAIYLMIGLPQDMVVSTVGLCLVLAFCISIYTHYAPFGSTLKRKSIVALIALIVAFSGLYLNFGILYKTVSSDRVISTGDESEEWKEFSLELLNEAHERKQNVIIDFTANWCVNCQFNKVTVLHTSKINELIKKKNIVAIRADLTRPNPQIESLLHHLGSRSVPFLAVFSGDKPYQPIIMRDLINKKSLVDVLENLN